MTKFISILCATFMITFKIFAQEPVITFLPGMVGLAATTPGYQMNAEVGPDFKLHIISAGDVSFYGSVRGYYQYDENGVTVLRDNNNGDGDASYQDFNPGIGITPDGNTHLLTRDTSGLDDIKIGRKIRYRMVSQNNVWSRNYVIAQPKQGNTNVGVAAADNDHVYLATAEGEDVRFYQAGESSATDLGTLTKVDALGNRMVFKGKNGKVFFASGDNSQINFSWANAGNNLLTDLNANKTTITDGDGSKGMPDLYVNSQGVAHLCYGAENAIYFNKFDKNTLVKVFPTSVKIFDFSDGAGNLWSKKYGFGWLAASDDGKIIFAIGARVIAKGWFDMNGSPLPADFDNTKDPYIGYGSFGEQVSGYYFNYSTDGGVTWKGQTSLSDAPYTRQPAWIASGGRPTTVNYVHGKFFFSHFDVSWYKEFSVGIADFSAMMAIPDLGHDLTLCALPSTELDSKVAANGTTTFTWSKNGATVVDNSTTANTLTIDGAALYKVSVNGIETHAINVFEQTPKPAPYIQIDAFKREGCCYPVGDNFVNIYAYPIPPKRDAITYTWYQDNTEITDNNKNDLFIYDFGVYRVKVQEPGCDPQIGAFQVAEIECPAACPSDWPTGIGSVISSKGSDILIFPNPVQDYFFVKGCDLSNLEVNITIYNIKNQIVLQKRQILISPVIVTETTMPAGIYIVKIEEGTKSYTQKFIKR